MTTRPTTWLFLSLALLPVLAPPALPAAEPTEEKAVPPAKINVKNLPATVVDNVVVPVPSEIFSVLDKLGEPDWRSEVREIKLDGKYGGKRALVALVLGKVIADGFIAVQAQDAERVKAIGKDVLDLASAIAVQESVLPHCNAIIKAADAGDWKVIRVELDKAQQNVRNAMIELKDEPLSQIVSIAGWLRGTEALTSVVKKNFTPDGAELLRQPELLDYFIRRLDSMPASLKDYPLIQEIRADLARIAPLVNLKDGREITAQSVSDVHKICAEIVSKIETAH